MLNASALKKRMIDANMTQGALAEAIGVSKSSFSNKMHGKTEFTGTEIMLLCSVLQIESAEEKCDIFLSNLYQ